MSTVKPYQDIETRRQYRNLTSTQQKNISEMKEGLVVNTLIKEPLSLENMYDSLVIPDKAQGASKNEKAEVIKQKSMSKTLTPLLLTTTGVFGLLAGSMAIVASAAKHRTKLPTWKTLPEVPKNIAINNEPHFATYLMIQDPSTKTVLGALGVFVLGAIGLIGKNFVDGVKAIWVRKKEADVQRDLQEKLIAVETKSFSGKMQILRNMLSEKAHELDAVLKKNNMSLWDSVAFKKFVSFGGNNAVTEKDTETLAKNGKNKDMKTAGLIGVTALAVAGLGFLAFRNVRKTAELYKNYEKDLLNHVQNMIKDTDVKADDLEYIKNLFKSLRMPKAYIEETIAKIKTAPLDAANKPIDLKAYTVEVIKEVEQISQKGAEAIAGSPGTKPSYYSHTNDERAHLYNMIVNPENPLLKILFAGMTTVTGVGYIGTQVVEAMREVEVIKENAKIELNLQQRLVSVEMKNFETKKKSVIEPLIDEFKAQAQNGKEKKELKVRAENILYEIKNGPPFVYS